MHRGRRRRCRVSFVVVVVRCRGWSLVVVAVVSVWSRRRRGRRTHERVGIVSGPGVVEVVVVVEAGGRRRPARRVVVVVVLVVCCLLSLARCLLLLVR